MLDWLFSWIFPRKPAKSAKVRLAARPKETEPQASTSAAQSPASEPGAALPKPPRPVRAAPLDHVAQQARLSARESAILERVSSRIERGDLIMPQLPATSLQAIELCAKPHVEIGKIVELIENDPVLSTELLRTANSALYAGAEPAQTLNAAVLRLGLRALRSMLYTVSVRGTILRDRALATYAEELWRQSSSTARLARSLATSLGFEPERAYLIGLLHDVGKLPLLGMLRREIEKESEITPALVGRMFLGHHEAAGAVLARAWKLPEEIESVAGNHHHFETNTSFPKAAALASLVHRLDIELALGSEDLRNMLQMREFEFLEVSEAQRHALLARAQEQFLQGDEALSQNETVLAR